MYILQIQDEANNKKTACAKGSVCSVRLFMVVCILGCFEGSLSLSLCLADSISAEGLYHLMKDSSINVLVMDARSRRDFEESHVCVPSQACISVPEEAISPG